MLKMKQHVNEISRVIQSNLWLCLGLAAYWPMFRNPYTMALFSLPYSGAEANLLDSFFLYSLIAALCGLFICAAPAIAEALCKGPSIALFGGAIAATGNLIIVIEPALTAILPRALPTGIILTSLGFAVLSTQSMTIAQRTKPFDLVVIAAGSFVLSHISFVLDVLPKPFNLLAPLLPPLAAGLFFFLAIRQHAQNTDRSRISSARYMATGKDLPSPNLYPFIAACLACEFVVLSATRMLWTLGREGYSTGPLAMVTYSFSIAVGIAVLFFALCMRKPISALFVSMLAASALTIVGTCMHAFTDLSTCIAAASRSLIQLLIWTCLANYSLSAERAVGVRSAGVFLIIDSTCTSVIQFIVPALIRQSGIAVNELVIPFSLIGTLLASMIALCTLALIIGRRLDRPESAEPSRGNNCTTSERWMQEFAKANKLTQRETDIVGLVARGRSVRVIAESLCISQSTVQAHMKSIYRKLGIHNKQSLLDLVDETRALDQ